MARRERQSAVSDRKPLEKERTGEDQGEEAGADSCRCKEVSKKTPLELLKLMIDDLAFWKKGKHS
ncbi:MAG TPA: hypothetical protein VFG09_09215 [Thermodesulfovibrionales bacterium]|nr:hypothetical protein [Thermodesulfovibrionales bacterium]